jgi:serine/threonine-protein kinase
MATVWRAYDLDLEIPVAVKLAQGSGTDLLGERLTREARAAGRIEHPAIVRVLDAAKTAEGVPFLVLELLDGETLADLLARERIGAARAVQQLLPIIDGLAVAHEQGVVHRDLKPSNVFLDVRGKTLQPRLVDFGIAKLADGAPRLTADGLALGSPSYMSPEQARGEDVDFRSDIWSMCVLLHRAIGGSVPFKGPNTRAILDAVIEQVPPPLPLGAGVDEHLSRIIATGLSKEPRQRQASMRKLGEQLAGWLLLHGVSVDACEAPLMPKWLGSEEPISLGERTAPITRRLGPPARSAPPSARSVPPSTRRTRARRRWMLWALAGVLVAGASLALSKSASREGALAAQPVLAVAEIPVVLPSPPEALLTPAEASVTTPLDPALEALESPRGGSPSTSVPAVRGGGRPKNPPARRPELPF